MEELRYYQKAGAITRSVLNYSTEIIKSGMSILEFCEELEDRIRKLGGIPAFPVNVCINEIAAHDTAAPNDHRRIKPGDLVKVDVGVHVNGYIADAAISIEVEANKHEKLREVCAKALEMAIKKVAPGIRVFEIGRTIERCAKEEGFTPVVNLGGHSIERFNLHAGKSIPNYDNGSLEEVRKGDVIAIEPFLTIGEGRVIETKDSEIFKFVSKKPVRNESAREVLNFIEQNYGNLPFAKRWLFKEFGNVDFVLKQLVDNLAIRKYNVLKEDGRKVIVQFEHTIVVLDTPIVITR
ncbi:MAG: type II methionyl aminopeptidase [Candidatus Nanoarchaeia archaeon]|nr:type II methionyl aminopeptidase [Candidatus Haiyanarchaeum thermophilum]MCW1303260.1 type II methionyl aminopeptidase [Candidatus Haiyanarchaeum thermophilum]MCW1304008.1 type II methionyl aminopeptidase [Candidatus Haiyanarchaeum thermophilum]MCW1306420.1 type II methionyl aminopeptidase [Candidatus Haiyanarchaeum thermophilum]MCW1307282.1 type II methionyl aminopeptidase [Candidatus Haiyanarchaeum thermophilum]